MGEVTLRAEGTAFGDPWTQKETWSFGRTARSSVMAGFVEGERTGAKR